MRVSKNMIAGGIAGFGLFVAGLESKGMGNIIIRNGRFSLENVWEYIKSPFHQSHLWNPELLQHNWVVMTSCGAALGACTKLFKK